MKKVFVDTGAWYALVDKKDPDHKSARNFLLTNRLPLLTTNFIFDEIVTLLRSHLGWSVAKEFGLKIKDSNLADIIPVKDEDEAKGWEIFLDFKDKDFSYTDCTSFAVMERFSIDNVFTFDKHFSQYGKFIVMPS
ncbi:MAG: type II toxin-antitoxin system VapC family toxin [Nitrospirota bacterium]